MKCRFRYLLVFIGLTVSPGVLASEDKIAINLAERFTVTSTRDLHLTKQELARMPIEKVFEYNLFGLDQLTNQEIEDIFFQLIADDILVHGRPITGSRVTRTPLEDFVNLIAFVQWMEEVTRTSRHEPPLLKTRLEKQSERLFLAGLAKTLAGAPVTVFLSGPIGIACTAVGITCVVKSFQARSRMYQATTIIRDRIFPILNRVSMKIFRNTLNEGTRARNLADLIRLDAPGFDRSLTHESVREILRKHRCIDFLSPAVKLRK